MKAHVNSATIRQPEFLHELGVLRVETHMTRTEIIEVALRLLENAQRADDVRQAQLQIIEM